MQTPADFPDDQLYNIRIMMQSSPALDNEVAMSADSRPLPMSSDALKANLLETAAPVVIDPAFSLLRDIVSRFQGIQGKLDTLLYEINHPYHNWKLIIPELRAFVLKNCNNYRDHEQGPKAFTLFMDIFFDAIKDAGRNEQLLQRILEAMLAYADKLILSLDSPTLFRFEQALTQFFTLLRQLGEAEPQIIMAMVHGHQPVRKIARKILELRKQQSDKPFECKALALLLRITLRCNYEYWLSEEDPLPWFTRQCGDYCQQWQGQDLLLGISHQSIREAVQTMESVDFAADYQAALEVLLTLPNHMDIVRMYKEIPSKMVVTDVDDEESAHFVENRKLLFLFRIMETSGLSLIHEGTLREINRSLVQLIRKQSFEEIEQFFVTTFHLLKVNVRRYPHTSLQCIQVIGNEVFKRGNSRLVEAFLWEAVRFGFQYANVRGV
ncbi:MAG: phosphoenolpyruvate synthase, partial [Desulfobulbus sp.]|nr:phosphoenolpyruvate synthase [Desulfobulbus sp.]